MSNISEIQPGTIIFYKLDPKDGSKGLLEHPDRVWVGRVKRGTVGIGPCVPGFYVESLEEGYEGLEEWVPVAQIICYSTRDAVVDASIRILTPQEEPSL